MPAVTIGIPTYNRPHLLRRALTSVADQHYTDLHVLVADNASPGRETADVVASFADRLPSISYHRHDRNVGSLANFLFLLHAAETEYFMWLADDDEISPSYVSHLVMILEENPDAAAAAGHWHLMRSDTDTLPMPTAHFPQRSAMARALRFIWRSDDAFFYALHRTAVLRTASFPGYVWPNRGIVLNWAYVYLLDVVLSGRILLAQDPAVQFINHDYTAKSYTVTHSGISAGLAHVCRRVNVHALYVAKCARRLGLAAAPVVIGTSVASLLREHARAAIKLVAADRRAA